jgi:cell division protein FtsI/penicillin-binding protein 2
VISQDIAEELRSMLVRTTTNGTARRAFRDRRGRPKLGSVRVAGKTGNLNGDHPKGRYEWFVGVAPAERPSIAVAVVQVHGKLWWSKSSEVAADLLAEIFCDRGRCDASMADRFTVELSDGGTPVLLSDSSAAAATPRAPGPGG